MKRINLREDSYHKLINEISYGTVDHAYDRANDIFWDVRSKFEDFYNSLNDAIYKVKYESEEGEQTNNPYLQKMLELSEPIYDILNKKYNQQNKFYDATTSKIDHDKFYDSLEGNENDIDDMDLTYLQKNYPK